MALHIPAFERLLKLWITTFKILGGFPYSWTKECNGTWFLGLRKRRSLEVWSKFMVLVNFVVVIVPNIPSVVKWTQNPYEKTPRMISLLILQFMEAIVSIMLQLHLWTKSDNFFSIVSQMGKFSSTTTLSSWTIARNLDYIIVIILHCAYLVIVPVMLMLWPTENVPQRVLKIFFYFLFTAITIVYAFSFYTIGRLIDMTFADISCLFKIESTKTSVREEESCKKNQQITDIESVNCTHLTSYISTEYPIQNSKTISPNIKCINKLEVNAEDVSEACRRIYEMQQLQRLMSQYYSLPCLALTAMSTSWLISDVHKLATGNHENEPMFNLILFMLYNASIIVLFCFGADKIKEKKYSVQLMVSNYRLLTSDGELQKQLSHLLDLLDIFPDFSVGGFYIASRGTLVAIASFIATYLVILLQFDSADNY